jgi:CRAL/TRIO domain
MTQWCLFSLALLPVALGFSVSNLPVSTLLSEHASTIANLKAETAKIVPNVDIEPYANDVFYLRYCLQDFESDDARLDVLKDNLKWRLGEGKAICDAAQAAIAEATSKAGTSWNNDPVRKAAPNADIINNYLTTKQTMTTSTSTGDLIYCIRAGKIDDVGLMNSLDSKDQLVDFFIYCKEVNAAVANQRSLESDKLLYVLVANDLSDVKLIGGDATFRAALSEASKVTNNFYPSLNGPTLLLNLPALLGALVKIFTPLFPAEVRKRLKFERGPLKNVDDMMDISYGGSARQDFLDDIDRLVYSN